MKTLTVDDDLYRFIASKTERIGEDESSILRRLLKLSATRTDGEGESTGELDDVLESATYRTGTVTERYLQTLSAAIRARPEAASSLFEYRGRRRRYFAASAMEIERSGTSCDPQRIPGTEVWAMCNASNEQKRTMLRDALQLLGLPRHEAARLAEAISRD